MKKSIILLLTSLIILGLGGCSLTKNNETDAIKFKNEYESLNNTSNSSGLEHRTLSIDEDNPFVYISSSELIEKIENKETFFVYFGSAYCPWCRSVIEKAIEIAKENGIDTIYYVNIWDGDHNEVLRDTYQLNDSDEVELVKEGTEDYYKLLSYFDNILKEYTLTNSNGDKLSVGEKRIFAPSFIYVKKGESINLVTGISANQTDSREQLTEEILIDEETTFDEFFNTDDELCDLETNC